MRPLLGTLLSLSLSLAVFGDVTENPAAAPAVGDAPVAEAAAPEAAPDLETALERLDLPGVKINMKEWSVDVDARVCLREGLLELIACTADSKEHESIIAVDARPSHIHTALLLLGATPGNPAMVRIIESEDPDVAPRFVDIPPRGHPVGVFLVFDDDGPNELPISDFITKARHQRWDGSDDEDDEDGEGDEGRRFPEGPFLFTGSILQDAVGDGPRRYLSDDSGHVISIATFGDELLALPGIHGHANEGLMWEINSAKLPKLDAKITLRLRPERAAAPPPAAPADPKP